MFWLSEHEHRHHSLNKMTILHDCKDCRMNIGTLLLKSHFVVVCFIDARPLLCYTAFHPNRLLKDRLKKKRTDIKDRFLPVVWWFHHTAESIWSCSSPEPHRAQDHRGRHPAATVLPSHRHMSSPLHLPAGYRRTETLPPRLTLSLLQAIKTWKW